MRLVRLKATCRSFLAPLAVFPVRQALAAEHAVLGDAKAILAAAKRTWANHSEPTTFNPGMAASQSLA